MKKNVLALLLVAFMLIGLIVVGAPNARAEETVVHENHCVCGGAAVGVHDHECATIEWQALPEGTTDFGTLASGNYYLTADVAVTKVGNIGSSTVQKEISICLNGRNITSQGTRVFGYTWAGCVLNICDCSYDAETNTFGGTVTAGTGSGKYGGVIYTYSKSEFNVYGGNFTSLSTNAINGSVFEIANDQCADLDGNGKIENADKNHFSEASTLNVYNGNIYGSVTTSGAGGLIHSFHAAAINIHGGTISGGQSAAYGGNIYVSGQGQVTVTGGTITGGNGTNGGNVYATNLVISGGSIGGGTASDNGGNVYATNLVISGGSIGGGTAANNGGNVWGTNITMSGGSIFDGKCTKNRAAVLNTSNAYTYTGGNAINTGVGGNVYVGGDGYLNMTGGSIYNGIINGNTGGNIFIYGGKASTTITGGRIWGGRVNADNSVKGTADLVDTWYVLGGSIYFNGGTNTIGGDAIIGIDDQGNAAGGTVTAGGEGGNISTHGTLYIKGNAVIANGVANTDGSGKGGNLTCNSATVYIQENAVIRDGVAYQGGNITVFNNGKTYISGGTISGGSAPNGGNIIVDGNNDNADVLTISGGTIKDGSAKNGGNILLQKSTKVINITGGTISGGTASNVGGNIYMNGGTLTVENAVIRGGTAQAVGDGSTGESQFNTGGGSFHCTNNGTITLNSGAVVENGKAEHSQGGCFYIAKGTLNINEGATVSGGTSSGEGQYGDYGGGGNIFLFSSGVLNINGGIVTGGKAPLSAGGNMRCYSGSKTCMTSGTITLGTAKQGGNVALFGSFDFQGGTISDGVASDNGGNVRIFRGTDSTMTMGEKAVVSGGTAGNGGNFHLSGVSSDSRYGELIVNGGTITGGTATSYWGGNIRVTSRGKLVINSGIISDGTAKTTNGGNICVDSKYSVLEIAGGTISNGIAKTNGGNLYIGTEVGTDKEGSAGYATITGGEFIGGGFNADTTGYGANIYTSGIVTISGATISDGFADHGGNLCINSGNATVTNCTITGGKANRNIDNKGNGNGGNIYVGSAGSATLTDCTISDGQARRGGNVAAFGPTTISGGTISGGYANSGAGNVFVYNKGNLTVNNGCQIVDGKTAENGGNIAVSYGGEAYLTDVTITGGVTGAKNFYGGSIYVGGVDADGVGPVLCLTDSTVSGGTAQYGGAVSVTNHGSVTISGSTLGSANGSRGRCAYIGKDGILTIQNSDVTNLATTGTGIWNCGKLVLQGVVNMPSLDAGARTMDFMVDAQNSEEACIDISELTGQDEAYGIRRWETDEVNDDPGLLAIGATEEKLAMFFAWKGGYEISYVDGCLYLAPKAVQIMNGTNVVNGYATLDEALADSAEATHYVLYASMDGQTISKNILLDLNGKHLTNTAVNEGVTVQLYDTANNGFDASACGSLSGTVNGTMEVMTRSQDGDFAYVVICEDGVYSAHRFYRALQAISLNPAEDALGYKATFRCDDVLSKYVVDYGFQLWVENGSVKSYGKSEFVSGNLTLRLKNILAAGGGEMTISGRAYIVFEVDGVKYNSDGSTTTTTMKDTVETINAAYAADNTVYSAAQMSAVQALVTKYADATSGWAVADILAWTAPVVDESTDA